MVEQGLGRFGDRRLEKGGRSCSGAWWRAEAGAYVFGGLAEIGPERSA